MTAIRMTNTPAATQAAWTLPDDPRLAYVLALADDELAIGHRHSHWTGVAPTLEEDLAFSSLAQDEIGHAAVWYGVAEEMTGEDTDTLAFGRRPEQYRHAILLEREPGDWAYSLLRQHAYDLFDHVRLSVLTDSADASINGVLGPIMREERIHRAHARAWLTRVQDGPADGMQKVRAAVPEVLGEAGGLFEAVPWEEELVKSGVLPVSSADQAIRWREAMAADYDTFGLADLLDTIDMAGGLGGRQGTHSADFPPMWEEMTALFRAHPGGDVVTTDVAALPMLRAAVEGVLDPEMPPITIGELGMVLDVALEGHTVRVEVMPTFSGCPAIDYIGRDIVTAAKGVGEITDVQVVWRRDIEWGPERISAEGRDKLTEAGIAPPGSGQTLLSIGGVRCPYCGSRNTRADSPFGSAPCRSTHSCRDCKTPFDAIKSI